MEALIHESNLRAIRDYWEEVRLVRNFANHVDGIFVFQDVLMPRSLEIHLDDSFWAREFLQRSAVRNVDTSRRSRLVSP